jgi:hypothetical protein
MNGGNTGETNIYYSDVQDIINFALKNQTPQKITVDKDLPSNSKVKKTPNKSEN